MRTPLFIIIAIGFSIFHAIHGNIAATIWALTAALCEVLWIIRLNRMLKHGSRFMKDIGLNPPSDH